MIIRKVCFVLLLLVTLPIVIIADSNDYPWYFDNIGIKDCWKYIPNKKPAVVYIIDSKVSFGSILKGKSYLAYKCKNSKGAMCPSNIDKTFQCEEKNEEDNELCEHGTNMAGLIAGDFCKVPLDKKNIVSINEKGEILPVDLATHLIAVAGVAPQSIMKSMNIKYPPHYCNKDSHELNEDQEEKCSRARYRSMKFTVNYLKGIKKEKLPRDLFPTGEEPHKLVSMSNSGRTTEDIRNEWKTLLKDMSDNDMLVVVAVGNDYKHMGSEVLPDAQQLWPAAYNPSTESKDPLIRVGATNVYEKQSLPKRADFSNYGNEYVDILAPGEKIPVITTRETGQIQNGTSHATAIVAGTVACLAMCNQEANVQEIKEALFNGSDKYDHLTDEVKKGRVLNLAKVTDSFCLTNIYKPKKSGK